MLERPMREVVGDPAMARWLSPTSESRIERVPCDDIVERPWLTDVDAVALKALTSSIARCGIVEPLLLRPRADGRVEVVAGARRLLCARELQLASLPALVRHLSDADALLIGLWSSRDHLPSSPYVRARLHARLLDSGVPDSEAAGILGDVKAVRPSATLTLNLAAQSTPATVAPARFLAGDTHVCPALSCARAEDVAQLFDLIDPAPLARQDS